MTSSWASIIGIVFMLIAAGFALGWIVPLVVGLVRIRRKQWGWILVAIGGVWGLLAVASMIGIANLFRGRVEEFDPAQYDGPMATITWPGEQSGELMLVDQKRNKMVRTPAASGRAQMRTGTFSLFRYVMKKHDDSNVEWAATGALGMTAVPLVADSTHELKAGPPFAASVAVQTGAAGREVLSFNVKDVGGNSCSFTRSGSRTAPPGFEIRDETGKALFSGKFEYG